MFTKTDIQTDPLRSSSPVLAELARDNINLLLALARNAHHTNPELFGQFMDKLESVLPHFTESQTKKSDSKFFVPAIDSTTGIQANLRDMLASNTPLENIRFDFTKYDHILKNQSMQMKFMGILISLLAEISYHTGTEFTKPYDISHKILAYINGLNPDIKKALLNCIKFCWTKGQVKRGNFSAIGFGTDCLYKYFTSGYLAKDFSDLNNARNYNHQHLPLLMNSIFTFAICSLGIYLLSLTIDSTIDSLDEKFNTCVFYLLSEYLLKSAIFSFSLDNISHLSRNTAEQVIFSSPKQRESLDEFRIKAEKGSRLLRNVQSSETKDIFWRQH